MGFWSAVANATGNGRLDRLCRELGWSIDFRRGEMIGLHFKGDYITPQRTVCVFYRDGGTLMLFGCECRAEFTEHNLPKGLLAAMLGRNSDTPLGAWVAEVEGDTLSLELRYGALPAGVDAAAFKLICLTMVEEVAEVEANLRGRGIL